MSNLIRCILSAIGDQSGGAYAGSSHLGVREDLLLSNRTFVTAVAEKGLVVIVVTVGKVESVNVLRNPITAYFTHAEYSLVPVIQHNTVQMLTQVRGGRLSIYIRQPQTPRDDCWRNCPIGPLD